VLCNTGVNGRATRRRSNGSLWWGAACQLARSHGVAETNIKQFNAVCSALCNSCFVHVFLYRQRWNSERGRSLSIETIFATGVRATPPSAMWLMHELGNRFSATVAGPPNALGYTPWVSGCQMYLCIWS
jgi:hypothetical protein